MKQLIANGSVALKESDGKKIYELIDADKLYEIQASVILKPEKIKKEKIEVEEPEGGIIKQSGRDLTTYKFLDNEYNKGRLAHAIISEFAREKKPSFKALVELFPDLIVRPYGVVKPIKEAKEMSKERQRFFIKPEEEIKIRDCNIAVSNQWTVERIQQVISIAKKQLGYKIK
jgi:hypothetical protein